MSKNIVYKLKSFAFGLIYRICTLFPTKNKVFFSCFGAKRYGDSPKYISEELHHMSQDIKIVWARHRDFNFELPGYVKCVKWPSLAYFYELATSRVWVDSHLKRPWVKKRKGQYFIETWHGGLGFKKIEGDVDNADTLEERKWASHTASIADLFISNSDWISNIYRNGFHYNGEILECGYPKNDIFFKDNRSIIKKVKEAFSIDADTAIVLYAPTFRDHPDFESFNLNFDKLIEAFEQRFQRKCVFFIRMHPLMRDYGRKFYCFSEKIIDVTEYSDAQEIILSADYFITDYSSIVFDFMLTGRPAFLFVADLDNYRMERGLYMELSDYPFLFGTDNDTLVTAIQNFDNNVYQEKIESFILNVGLRENGNAAEQVVERIMIHF